MVVVAIRYMLLAVTRFVNTDEHRIDVLMYGIQREVINKMVECSVILTIDTLIYSIRECLESTEDQINEPVSVLINKHPEAWRCRFMYPQAG